MRGSTRSMDRDDVRGILARGGTILGTSRMDPYVHGDGFSSVARTVKANGIDAVVVIGGDGTLRSALRLSEEGLKLWRLRGRGCWLGRGLLKSRWRPGGKTG